MNAFDVWLRKQAVKRPGLYGAQMAAEGREILGEEAAERMRLEGQKEAKASRPGASGDVLDRKSQAAGETDEDREFMEIFGRDE